MNKLFFFFLLSLLYLSLYIASVNAQTMSNDNYIIQMGNLNSISGQPSGSGFNLNYTVGQTSPGLYTGENFKVRAGFQYVLSVIPFRFSISNDLIDFGTINPTFPVLRSSILTVSNGSAFGYQVTTSQNHNLRSTTTNDEIPPAACGDLGPACSPTSAGPWTSSLTYGFGYRCDNVNGSDCDLQFTNISYFKPFAPSPSTSIVMNGVTAGRSKQSQVTYKINISGAQPAGIYTNVVNYIATPTF
jgi:hypothetical protein